MQEEVDLSRLLSIRVQVHVPGLEQGRPAGDSDPAETAWSLFVCAAPFPAQHPVVGPGGPCTLGHTPSSLLGATRPSPCTRPPAPGLLRRLQPHRKASPDQLEMMS